MNPPVGLESTTIPSDRWVQLETETQVRKLLDNVKINGNFADSVPEQNEDDDDIDNNESETLGVELTEVFENEKNRERAEKEAEEESRREVEREQERRRAVEEEEEARHLCRQKWLSIRE
jgi:hypothetical protein